MLIMEVKPSKITLQSWEIISTSVQVWVLQTIVGSREIQCKQNHSVECLKNIVDREKADLVEESTEGGVLVDR